MTYHQDDPNLMFRGDETDGLVWAVGVTLFAFAIIAVAYFFTYKHNVSTAVIPPAATSPSEPSTTGSGTTRRDLRPAAPKSIPLDGLNP
jgi:hypothetical protein